MKYALLADIHANLEALEAVLRDQKAQGCTHMACLGDIELLVAESLIEPANAPC